MQTKDFSVEGVALVEIEQLYGSHHMCVCERAHVCKIISLVKEVRSYIVCNVTFSICALFVLTKPPFYFLSACCTASVGIALRCL